VKVGKMRKSIRNTFLKRVHGNQNDRFTMPEAVNIILHWYLSREDEQQFATVAEKDTAAVEIEQLLYLLEKELSDDSWGTRVEMKLHLQRLGHVAYLNGTPCSIKCGAIMENLLKMLNGEYSGNNCTEGIAVIILTTLAELCYSCEKNQNLVVFEYKGIPVLMSIAETYSNTKSCKVPRRVAYCLCHVLRGNPLAIEAAQKMEKLRTFLLDVAFGANKIWKRSSNNYAQMCYVMIWGRDEKELTAARRAGEVRKGDDGHLPITFKQTGLGLVAPSIDTIEKLVFAHTPDEENLRARKIIAEEEDELRMIYKKHGSLRKQKEREQKHARELNEEVLEEDEN